MKIFFINKDKLTIFLNKCYIKDIDIFSSDVLEKYLRQLFRKIYNNYQLKLSGYYEVVIYNDIKYGIIIEMVNEEVDYYHYLETEIDMRIVIKKVNFLYEIEDIFSLNKELLEHGELLSYQNSLYYNLTEELGDKDMGYLLEFSEIKYKDINIILKKAKKLKNIT